MSKEGGGGGVFYNRVDCKFIESGDRLKFFVGISISICHFQRLC